MTLYWALCLDIVLVLWLDIASPPCYCIYPYTATSPPSQFCMYPFPASPSCHCIYPQPPHLGSVCIHTQPLYLVTVSIPASPSWYCMYPYPASPSCHCIYPSLPFLVLYVSIPSLSILSLYLSPASPSWNCILHVQPLLSCHCIYPYQGLLSHLVTLYLCIPGLIILPLYDMCVSFISSIYQQANVIKEGWFKPLWDHFSWSCRWAKIVWRCKINAIIHSHNLPQFLAKCIINIT